MKFKISFLTLSFLLSSFAFAYGIEFNEEESPYITIQKAYNSATPIKADQIPTKKETVSRTKVLRALYTLFTFETTLEDVHRSGSSSIFKQVNKIIIPAIPSQGPLFPGKPESETFETEIRYCYYACDRDQDFPKDIGKFIENEQGAEIKWPDARYSVRIKDNIVILKGVKGDNEVVYGYGWIE